MEFKIYEINKSQNLIQTFRPDPINLIHLNYLTRYPALFIA
jgi:hypothetical protein